MAYALKTHRTHVKFDKIHRDIRDCKFGFGQMNGWCVFESAITFKLSEDWTANLLDLVNLTTKRGISWMHVLKQRRLLVIWGNYSENALLWTMTKILWMMKISGIQWQKWNLSRTKVSWLSQLVGLVGISVVLNIWLNVTIMLHI